MQVAPAMPGDADHDHGSSDDDSDGSGSDAEDEPAAAAEAAGDAAAAGAAAGGQPEANNIFGGLLTLVDIAVAAADAVRSRSEERRVGKEC